MSEPIKTLELVRSTERVERAWTYADMLKTFPDGDGSLVNPLVRRCQDYETEIDRLTQAALNGTECSQCLSKATEPACMYCAACYGKLVAEIDRLTADRDTLRDFVREGYSKFRAYHPYAHELRARFPWLMAEYEAAKDNA